MFVFIFTELEFEFTLASLIARDVKSLIVSPISSAAARFLAPTTELFHKATTADCCLISTPRICLAPYREGRCSRYARLMAEPACCLVAALLDAAPTVHEGGIFRELRVSRMKLLEMSESLEVVESTKFVEEIVATLVRLNILNIVVSNDAPAQSVSSNDVMTGHAWCGAVQRASLQRRNARQTWPKSASVLGQHSSSSGVASAPVIARTTAASSSPSRRSTTS